MDIKKYRHEELRAWLREKGLSDAAFAASIPANINTTRKWIYEGKPPRQANRTLLERAFPDCPILKWR